MPKFGDSKASDKWGFPASHGSCPSHHPFGITPNPTPSRPAGKPHMNHGQVILWSTNWVLMSARARERVGSTTQAQLQWRALLQPWDVWDFFVFKGSLRRGSGDLESMVCSGLLGSLMIGIMMTSELDLRPVRSPWSKTARPRRFDQDFGPFGGVQGELQIARLCQDCSNLF